MRPYIWVTFVLGTIWCIHGHSQVNHMAVSPSCRHSDSDFKCVQFVDSYDGDTFRVNIPRVHHFIGHKVPIRVSGIDAGELISNNECEREAAVKAATALNHELINAKRIDLKNISRDKYFRILAEVYVDGKNLGTSMIRRGLARPYDGGDRSQSNWCP